MEGFQSSRIDKKKASAMSTGFDFSCEDDGASQYDLCIGDETDLEQDYITKLKTQRERMQKLQKCYLQKQQQLSKQVCRTNQLLSQIEHLTTFLPYKQKYEELSQDYTDLLSKYNIQQNQLEIVKQELQQIVQQNGNTISRLKNQLKSWRDASLANANQLEESITDREDEVRKLRRECKEKEDQMAEEIKGLKTMLAKIKIQLQAQAHLHDKDKDRLTYEVKSRDAMILDLEKALQHSRKTNLEMKNDISKFSEEVNSREHELSTICAKLKHQLNQSKKIISEKECRNEESTSQIKKLNQIIQQMKKQNQNIKIDFKKTCELYENGNKKLKYESDSQIGRLEAFIKELKDSIQELMQVKNHLMMENRKLVAILKKKEQTEKQRKQLLRTQFKEIDRIQKVIDRLE